MRESVCELTNYKKQQVSES